MPDAFEEKNPNIIGWGPCRIWGQGRLYSSRCVVIPAPLAKRMRIENGDYLMFKENGATGQVTIEIRKRKDVDK